MYSSGGGDADAGICVETTSCREETASAPPNPSQLKRVKKERKGGWGGGGELGVGVQSLFEQQTINCFSQSLTLCFNESKP